MAQVAIIIRQARQQWWTPSKYATQPMWQVVRAAIANEQPLEIIGHGTKRGIGQPTATNAVLDLSALNAVTAYEPNELIVTVQAGAPLADVLSLIDSKNQQFAFEPMNTAPLLGTPEIGHHRRHDRGRSRRAAPHQGRRRAGPSARRACGVGSATVSRPAARW